MSAWKASPWPPPASIISTVRFASATSRSTTITRVPARASRIAAARPLPMPSPAAPPAVPDREPAAGRVARGGGVEQRERPEVGDVVDAAPAALLLTGRELVGGALHGDVERDLARVLGVEAQGMVDRLQEQPVAPGEDGRDRVHELSQVRDAHRAALADEAVQVGRDRQRVGQVVALLDAADAVLEAPRAVPHVPLV